MKKFKIFNVYNVDDKSDMEEEISSYLNDGYDIEKISSTIKKDTHKLEFTEYQVILNDEG